MDDSCFVLAEGFISKSYIRQGKESISQRQNMVKTLLSQRRLPEKGWDDATIELFLQDLSLMDSNNFLDASGMGEREGRVYSQLVRKRNMHFSHGIGRSGNITEQQPKAAGSSLIARLTNYLVKDAFKLAGFTEIEELTVLPVATGMALSLSLQSLHRNKPNARYVLFSRIDQKACIKSIHSAGLDIVMIPTVLKEDELHTDMECIEKEINQKGVDDVLCIMSTTSCFAPRACDKIVDISKICEKYNISHIINNAYGVQSSKLSNLLSTALCKGRVDGIIQSTDKNFLVPVGGSIISSGKKYLKLISDINSNYPGRASISPILDLFITLLSLGKSGYKNLLLERELLYNYLKEKLIDLSHLYGEKVLSTPNNPISLALTLKSFDFDSNFDFSNLTLTNESSNSNDDCNSNSNSDPLKTSNQNLSFIGSMLFSRHVSGCRVIEKGKVFKISGVEFNGFGSSYDCYPYPYLTCAAALGQTKEEIDLFMTRLKKTLDVYIKKAKK